MVSDMVKSGRVFNPTSAPAAVETSQKVLAKYSIPLGANEAILVFSGEQLAPEDFDALIEYVQLFKKQYERKLASFKALDDAAKAEANAAADLPAATRNG